MNSEDIQNYGSSRSTVSSDYDDDDDDEGEDQDQLQDHVNPEAKLLSTVRNSLEKSQYLRRIRCEMRQKVLDMVNGAPLGGVSGATGDSTPPPQPIQLLNQLILEYFDWYNLQYSAEMFSVESTTPRLDRAIRRQTLLSSLKGTLTDGQKLLDFQPDLPMLVELVMKLVTVGAPQQGQPQPPLPPPSFHG